MYHTVHPGYERVNRVLRSHYIHGLMVERQPVTCSQVFRGASGPVYPVPTSQWERLDNRLGALFRGGVDRHAGEEDVTGLQTGDWRLPLVGC